MNKDNKYYDLGKIDPNAKYYLVSYVEGTDFVLQMSKCEAAELMKIIEREEQESMHYLKSHYNKRNINILEWHDHESRCVVLRMLREKLAKALMRPNEEK